MDQSDENLLVAYRDGAPQAFADLVDRHAAGLLNYLRRLVGNAHDAEELVQETFIRVIARAQTFDPGRKFRPWLYAIASHLAIDEHRRAERRPQTISMNAETATDAETATAHLQVADSAPNPAEALALTERKRRVHEAVAALPPRQRATLILAYFQGLSYPQVAEVLDCSVGTVKTQMSRALQTLARTLPEPGTGFGPAGGHE